MLFAFIKRMFCSMLIAVTFLLFSASADGAEPIKERSVIVQESVKGTTAKVAELTSIAFMYQYTGRAGDALVLYTGLMRVYGPDLPSLASP